jgi:KUP system potassium uptake protein
MPHVNWGLFLAAAWLVVTFGSSSKLAAAYGIAVSSAMVITTILAVVVARRRWGWPIPVVLLVGLIFGTVDVTFFLANAAKIAHGGWFPLAVAALLFTMMTTWRRGRRILAHRMRMRTKPLEAFLEEAQAQKPVRVPGTAVFMTSDPEGTPPALFHNFKHNKVLHERVVLLTILTAEIPHVSNAERVTVEEITGGVHRVKAQYGFMDAPNMHNIFGCCVRHGLILNMDDMTFFLGRETLLATGKPGMAISREKLFSVMSRNAQRATMFFGIPPERVIELGVEVEM